MEQSKKEEYMSEWERLLVKNYHLTEHEREKLVFDFFFKIIESQEEETAHQKELKRLAQVASTDLLRWKEEEIAVWEDVIEYGQSKEADLPLGASISQYALQCMKRIKAGL